MPGVPYKTKQPPGNPKGCLTFNMQLFLVLVEKR